MHNDDRTGVAANAHTQLAHGGAAHPLAPFLNRITHGDCFQLLPTLPKESVDLVVTDPPFLVKYKTLEGRRAYPNDDSPWWLKPVFGELFRVLKPNTFCVSFYGWAKADYFLQAWRTAGFHPVGHLIWTKRYVSRVGFTRACHEAAYLLIKGDPKKPTCPPKDVFRWEWAGNDLHPAQKPVMVMKPLIQSFSKRGDIVLDPFAGSGTTGVAARECGRQFILIEKVWNYYRAAEKRLGASARSK